MATYKFVTRINGDREIVEIDAVSKNDAMRQFRELYPRKEILSGPTLAA